MIRFRMDRNGRPSIGLGLSRENVNRLTAGQPILVDGKSVGTPEIDSVFIFFGETEHAMYKDLEKHIGPDTIVHLDPRVFSDSAPAKEPT